MSELQITYECTGCEACAELCPDVFKMDETTERAVVVDSSSTAACVEDAIAICPVRAIIRE